MDTRLFAIPDIHGERVMLEKLLNRLYLEEKMGLTLDKLIFLGDMVDRGPDSKGVLDVVRALQLQYPQNVVVLRGNHEWFLINCMRKGRYGDFQIWLTPNNGGSATLRSFSGTDGVHGPMIPNEYVEWLESLPLSHEEPGFFFSHAPIAKESCRQFSQQGKPFSEEELTWTYFDDEKNVSRHHVDKNGNPSVGVCGHIHRLNNDVFAPRHYKHYLFLDAGCGCYHKAPLVATEVISRHTVWVWPDGVKPIQTKRRDYIPEPR